MTRRFWVAAALAIPVLGARHGRDLVPAIGDLIPAGSPTWIQLRPGHPGGAVGRLAVLRARLDLGPHPEAEHVHAHRDGHGRGLAVQRRRDRGPGIFPDAFRMDGAVDVYFEAASVITALVLLGQVLELPRRERPPEPSRRCST
jgi:Cu+-exporting ATPase